MESDLRLGSGRLGVTAGQTPHRRPPSSASELDTLQAKITGGTTATVPPHSVEPPRIPWRFQVVQNFVHAGAAPLSALPAGIPPTAASAVAPRPCSLGVIRVFCALPPTFYGLSPTAAVLHARDPHRRVLEVRTLLDPTTGSSTLVPECRAAPCKRGTAVDLLSRVRGHYAPRRASLQGPNKCLTRARCSVTFRPMHNQNIHTKTAFREDLKYAREMIRRIEVALRGNDWEAVADECNEVEKLFSSMRCRATDNLEDAQSKKQWEEIQQAERARWQKIADKVCGDFTTAYGITFTGTVA